MSTLWPKAVWIVALSSALSALWAAGCARDPWSVDWEHNRRLAEADYAERRFRSAEIRFQMLLERAPNSRDQVDAGLRLGDVLAEQMRYEEAAQAYVAAWRAALTPAAAARAHLRLASLAVELPPSRAEGLTALWTVVKQYPSTVGALRALDALASAGRRGQPGSPDGELRVYERVIQTPALVGARVGDHARVRAARLVRDGHLEIRYAEAERWLKQVADDEPPRALWDDAQYERVLLAVQRGQFGQAIEIIDFIQSLREQPRIFGNYETKYYHRGQWLKYELYRYELRDFALAEATLDEFVREYSFSRQYDDALFALAEMRMSRGAVELARPALELLLAERPESPYAQRAKVMLERGFDPGEPGPWAPLGPGFPAPAAEEGAP